jgi:hypothetical protein
MFLKPLCSDVQYWHKISSEMGYSIICVKFEQFANLNFTVYVLVLKRIMKKEGLLLHTLQLGWCFVLVPS